MTAFLPPAYCGMPLDRSSAKRDDPAWIRLQLESEHARILPLWRDRNLFRQCEIRGGPAACFIDKHWFDAHCAQIAAHHTTEWIYLGHGRGLSDNSSANTPIFAADITHIEARHATRLTTALGVGAQFLDLRMVGPALAAGEAATMAYARGLAYWHRQNRYCGRCGSATRSQRGGHLRRCADQRCAREWFPRIDPAVIMLVEQLEPDDRIPRCLLGRHRGLPKRVYSTLAGYVDPGESLEEAVAREVMEETGVRVHRSAYLASQPWPFPASMMVGFRANTRDRIITIAENELEDARWFSAAELREFGEYDEPDAPHDRLALPRRDSIARALIETWLSENSA